MPKAILCTQAIFFSRQAFSFLYINHAETQSFFFIEHEKHEKNEIFCAFRVFRVLKIINAKLMWY